MKKLLLFTIYFLFLLMFLFIPVQTKAYNSLEINILDEIKSHQPGSNITLIIEIINHKNRNIKLSPGVILPDNLKLVSELNQIEIEAGNKKILLIPLQVDVFSQPGNFKIEIYFTDRNKMVGHKKASVTVSEHNDVQINVKKVPESTINDTYIIEYEIINQGNTVRELVLNINDNLNMDINIKSYIIKLLPGTKRTVTAEVWIRNLSDTRLHQVSLVLRDKKRNKEIVDKAKTMVKIYSKNYSRVSIPGKKLKLGLKSDIYLKQNNSYIKIKGKTSIFEKEKIDFILDENNLQDSYIRCYLNDSELILGKQSFDIYSLIKNKEKEGLSFKTGSDRYKFNFLYIKDDQYNQYGTGFSYVNKSGITGNVNYIFSTDKEKLLLLSSKYKINNPGLILDLELYNKKNSDSVLKQGAGVGVNYDNKFLDLNYMWVKFPQFNKIDLNNRFYFKNYLIDMDFNSNSSIKNKYIKRFNNRKKIKVEKTNEKDKYFRGIIYKELNKILYRDDSTKNNINKKNIGIYEKRYKEDNRWVYLEAGKKLLNHQINGYLNIKEYLKKINNSYFFVLNMETPLNNNEKGGKVEYKLECNNQYKKMFDIESSLSLQKFFQRSGFILNSTLDLKYKDIYNFKINVRTDFNHQKTKSSYMVSGKYSIPLNFDYNYNQGTVSGYLVDEKDRGVSTIKVRLNNYTAITDDNGFFRFDNIPEGEYYLSFSEKELDNRLIITPELPYKINLEKGNKIEKKFKLREKGSLKGKIIYEKENEFYRGKQKNEYQNKIKQKKNLLLKIKKKDTQYLLVPEGNRFSFKNLTPGKWTLDIYNENDLYKVIPEKKEINIKSGEKKEIKLRIKQKKRSVIIKKGGVISS
ncbi:MAG: hypothetical protein ACOC1O_04390 [bacterium]